MAKGIGLHDFGVRRPRALPFYRLAYLGLWIPSVSGHSSDHMAVRRKTWGLSLMATIRIPVLWFR